MCQCRQLEIAHLRRGEGFAEFRQPLLPFRFANDRQALDVVVVFDAEFKIIPRGFGGLVVKLAHLEQHPHFPVLLDQCFKCGDEPLIVAAGQFAADSHFQDLAAQLLCEFNWPTFYPRF